MYFGIIPAAGQGSRWGGALKELLPIGEERWLIDCTIEAMENAGVDAFCVVSSEEKIHSHVQHFKKNKYKHLNIFFVIQKEKKDIWGAILAALPYHSDMNYFAMPDTLYNTDCFTRVRLEPVLPAISFGVFNTRNSERFGVLHGDKIVNKSEMFSGQIKTAWGNFVFNEELAEEWLEHEHDNLAGFGSYTEALNYAIEYSGNYKTYPLTFYNDFASWKDYEKWMR